ncbi:GNAT family N-acetyltransferase [Methyloligella sp. 2.7D]|uniref:GNAT family N-acetyltransferase n=1 Tax=unclassified Methyloligella TaxID=2625955 RepID=UPI00157BD127|nr:GNAT family N-acetyltransferase [Methyloligella sp. GL2]QKP76517.1 GNAT family N-acetyltransferase [Methyloligella sp. GL2]
MGYEIRTMPLAEVEKTLDWAAREGWNPGLHDAECFYAIDPEGFFMGVLDDTPIARAAVLNYDDTFAFAGLYIVDPQYRAHGYGMALVEAIIPHAGDRNIGIDGVVEMQAKYELLGYRFAHRDLRYGFTPEETKPRDPNIVPVAEIPFGDLAAYDRQHFPAPREAFLQRWVAPENGVALGYVADGELRGYGVIRRCREGFKLAPLFADTPDIAEALFDALSNHGQGAAITIDVPEPNTAGLKLVQARGLSPVFECARMYLKGDPELPLASIFGLTSLEAG